MASDELKMEHGLKDADAIFRAGLKRVDSKELMRQSLARQGNTVDVSALSGKETIHLSKYKQIKFLAVGKAALLMAEGLCEILGDKISSGIVVTKESFSAQLPESVRVMVSSHPVPDERSELAAQALLKFASSCEEGELLIGLLSGGASALAALPVDGLSLNDKRVITKALLASGANIHEVNCVRKHLSAIKGGQLANAISPAESINFILSDVVGDDLSVIGSGLTAPDESTFADAWEIVERYHLQSEFPEAALRHLQRGLSGEARETPKPNDPSFSTVRNLIVGSNFQALMAAKSHAETLGYRTVVLTSSLEGEASEAAKFFYSIARDASRGLLNAPPICVLAGGETTVTLKGKGKGGRNQEMALAFLTLLSRARSVPTNLFFLSGATDGSDGPTDAAGAYASASLLREARNLKLDPGAYLLQNDSYGFYSRVGGLIKTGPTHTNVCDLQVLIIRP